MKSFVQGIISDILKIFFNHSIFGIKTEIILQMRGDHAFTEYNNDDFISSVKELQTIKNPYEYRENLRLLEKDIMEDSPWIFLGAYNYNLCSKPHVHGFEYDFSAAIDFSNVWVD